MSVELEVRLGSATVPWLSLLTSVSEELQSMFGKQQAATWPTWELSHSMPHVLGGEATTFRLAMAEEAAIEMRCYCIGTEDELGEDGGWWISLSAAVRSPETLCLALVTAACLAKLSKSRVLDDALLLKRGRWIGPDDVLAMIDGTENLSFKQAAARLKNSLENA